MKVRIMNVRLPRDLTLWLDSLVSAGMYKSRSEAIREFSREYLNAREARIA